MTNHRWRIGQLAASSGLSERALRYWDSVGLLCPSSRTDGGHREYDSEDLLRLYQVLGLRGLGLPLDSIATCLDGGADVHRIVTDQLAEVDQRMRELTTLHERLTQVEQRLDQHAQVSPELLLAVVRALHGPNTAALEALLDPEEIAGLGAAARNAGAATHYLLEIEWPELYRQAAALLAAGARADDPDVQRLVRRLDQLSAQFSGGDPSVSHRIRTAYRSDPAAISGIPDASTEHWQTVADFLDRARSAGGTDPTPTRNPTERPS